MHHAQSITLLSPTPSMDTCSGTWQAAATTGPASGPRPASSAPTTNVHPLFCTADNSWSRVAPVWRTIEPIFRLGVAFRTALGRPRGRRALGFVGGVGFIPRGERRRLVVSGELRLKIRRRGELSLACCCSRRVALLVVTMLPGATRHGRRQQPFLRSDLH